MYDNWEYLIPAGTAESAAKWMELKISLGVVTDIYLGFPAGCGTYDADTSKTYRLARCRLWHRTYPICPRSAKQFLAADDYVIHIPYVNYPILAGDAILDWELWNLDDTYPHQLWVGVNWARKEDVEASRDGAKWLKQLTEYFTGVTAEE